MYMYIVLEFCLCKSSSCVPSKSGAMLMLTRACSLHPYRGSNILPRLLPLSYTPPISSYASPPFFNHLPLV